MLRHEVLDAFYTRFWCILLKILKILSQNPENPPLLKSQISEKGGGFRPRLGLIQETFLEFQEIFFEIQEIFFRIHDYCCFYQ